MLKMTTFLLVPLTDYAVSLCLILISGVPRRKGLQRSNPDSDALRRGGRPALRGLFNKAAQEEESLLERIKLQLLLRTALPDLQDGRHQSTVRLGYLVRNRPPDLVPPP